MTQKKDAKPYSIGSYVKVSNSIILGEARNKKAMVVGRSIYSRNIYCIMFANKTYGLSHYLWLTPLLSKNK
jgi:hypothetical protein